VALLQCCAYFSRITSSKQKVRYGDRVLGKEQKEKKEKKQVPQKLVQIMFRSGGLVNPQMVGDVD
jgi:hypothetical protein